MKGSFAPMPIGLGCGEQQPGLLPIPELVDIDHHARSFHDHMNRFADFESRVPAGSPGDNRGHLHSRSDLHRHFRINGTDLDRCDRTIQNIVRTGFH
jgi:hypothetical protein